MTITEIILVIFTLLALAAAAIIWLTGRRREGGLRSELKAAMEENRGQQERITGLSSENAALKARLTSQEESLTKETERFAKSLEEMKNTFKALSAENSEHFRKTSAAAVGELLKPIQDKFDAFGKSIHESDEKAAARGSSTHRCQPI